MDENELKWIKRNKNEKKTKTIIMLITHFWNDTKILNMGVQSLV
jgi:hypothetical protein